MNIKAPSVDKPFAAVEPISQILGRVGVELDALAAELSRIQGLVGPLALKAASSLGPEFLQDIQAIDHIEQKIVCLSGFLTSLGPLMQGHWVLDAGEASDAVTLSELARRLRAVEHLNDENLPLSGDFEMF